MIKKIKANLYEISRFQCQENYRETAPYLEQPGHHCLHLLKNNTSCTKNLFPWLGESTDENKTLLFFTGWEAEFKVLAIPYNPLGHCLRKDFFNCDLICKVWKFCKDQTFSHMNWSVKTVNQIELERHPYWFLILVNSGFSNINLAASIPFLFTSCSRILQLFSVPCIHPDF